MKSISATDARKQWFAIIEQAGKPGVFLTIKHRDLPDVVLMSIEEFEGWQETLEILSDSSLMNDIREAMQERRTVPLEELEGGRHAVGHVRGRPQKKGRKAVRQTSRKR